MIGVIYRKLKLSLLQKDNKVFGYGVHPRSLVGEGIEVQSGSCIDSECTVGSYTYIGRNCGITKTSIGRYCSIANNVSIGQGEHLLDRISTNSIFYQEPYKVLTSKPCEIADDVWIGVGAVILRGVSVGVGAVIGANSVVTKNVPPFAIVVGTPAKIVRYRFDDNKIKAILDSKWWNENPVRAEEVFKEIEES